MTRSIRRLPKPFELELVGDCTVAPWERGYASLGHRMLYAKRLVHPVPTAIRDFAGGVSQPGIPDEAASDPPSPTEVEFPQDGNAAVTGPPQPEDGVFNDSPDEEVPAKAGPRMRPPPPTAVVAGPATPADMSGPSDAPAPMDARDSPGGHETEHAESGRPEKQLRINALSDVGTTPSYPFDDLHEDGKPEYSFSPQELDDLEKYELGLEDEDEKYDGDAFEHLSDDAELLLKEVIFPYTKDEPNLSATELQRLDSIADRIEMIRLKGLGVLCDPSILDGVEYKTLSTRFVRTWRCKHVDGIACWLRRSRFVAREFAWLSEATENLFSPASSAIAYRIIPTMFLKHQPTWGLYAIDIKDAFLTVEQRDPTMVYAQDASNTTVAYALGRVLPGQRSGSMLWHESLTQHLKDAIGLVECECYPSMLKSPCGQCFILLHVDDLFVTGSKQYVNEVLTPCLQSKYSIAVDSVESPGDEVSFLKRSHVLLEGGKMLIQSHHKHFSQMKELMGIGKKYFAKKTPSHPKIDDFDETPALADSDASKYRSAVGTLLYLAPDHPQCQHAIRFLATQMSKPTEHAWQVLKHLVLYMLGHQDVCLSLEFAGEATGVFHEYTNSTCGVLEVFTDADWGASKTTRCSISSCAIFYGGCLLYSASRTQRVVALSSAESEIYAAASGVCDAVLVWRILCWMLGKGIAIHLYLDSAAARGIMARRGVGKIRHLSCRCLWLQALVAAKDLQVSPVSGTKNPADLGTKRLSQHRMLGLMFVMGMHDTTLHERVGEEEAQTFLTQDHVKKAIKTINCCAKVPHQALQLMLLVNALGLGKGDDGTATSNDSSWMYGFLSLATAFGCALIGMFFMMRTVVRRQMRNEMNQQFAAGPEIEQDPAEVNEIDLQLEGSNEMNEPDDLHGTILNAEGETSNGPYTGDFAGEMGRQLRTQELPQPFARYSPEHMILWLIIRGQGRAARANGTDRGRLWKLRVKTLIELLQHVRSCNDATTRNRAMVTLLDAGDFSSDDESPFAGMTPDQRHHHIEDVGRAAEFADQLIQTLQTSDDVTREAVHDVLEAMDLMNSSAEENAEEEPPTSDMDVDDDRYSGMIEMHAQRRRTMRVFRVNRDAALAAGNTEEAAYWERQEDELHFL